MPSHQSYGSLLATHAERGRHQLRLCTMEVLHRSYYFPVGKPDVLRLRGKKYVTTGSSTYNYIVSHPYKPPWPLTALSMSGNTQRQDSPGSQRPCRSAWQPTRHSQQARRVFNVPHSALMPSRRLLPPHGTNDMHSDGPSSGQGNGNPYPHPTSELYISLLGHLQLPLQSNHGASRASHGMAPSTCLPGKSVVPWR